MTRMRSEKSIASKQLRANSDNSSGAYAFVGSAALADCKTVVQGTVLCWPSVASAWQALTHAWNAILAERIARDSGPGSPSSWIRNCAPQLGMPFQGSASAAEESSVAAVVARTPMYVAIDIVEANASVSKGVDIEAIRESGLSNCIATYDRHLRALSGRQPCSVFIARGQEEATNQQSREAFFRCQRRYPDSAWLQNVELRFWADVAEPLPLEMAQVVAAAVSRYSFDPSVPSPVVEAIRNKLALPHPLISRTEKKKRR